MVTTEGKTVLGRNWDLLMVAVRMFLFCLVGTASLFGQVTRQALANGSTFDPEIVLTPEEQTWLMNHPDIVLGFTDSLEPAVIAGPNGKHTGMLVDALGQINKRLGTRISLRLYDIPTVLENAQKKKVDGIVALNPEYAEKLGLLSTEVYWPDYPAVFARRGISFSGPEDFADQRVALIEGVYITQKMIDEHGKRTTVVKVKTALDGLRAVAKGEADLFLGVSYGSYYLTKYQLLELVTAHVFLDTPTWQCVGVRSDWPELVTILNKGLAQFSEEDVHSIIRKWSYLPIQNKRVELTPAEQAWIAQKHPVRVRVRHFKPHVFLDGDEPSGIAIDYLQLIAERTGIQFVFVNDKRGLWDAVKSMAQSQGPDLMFGMERDIEPQDKILFSQDYMLAPHVIYTRAESGFIAGIDDLKGRTLAIAGSGHRFSDKLEGITVQEFPTTEEALKAVSQGQADACICDLLVATYAIMEHGFSNLKVAAPGPLKDRVLCFGNRPDWPQLTSMINKGLATLTQAEKSAIQGNYLSLHYEHGIQFEDVLKWGGALVGFAILIILLFWGWNRLLHQKVKERTAEILEKESRFRRLVEQTPMAIEIHDLEGKIVQANPAFASMHNLEGEALNQILEHYNVRKDEQAEELGLQPYIERVYAGEDVIFPPYKYSTDEATKSVGHETSPHELWTQVRGFPLKNSAGQVINAVFFAEDITEQREAQFALKQEREYTDHLIQTANVMIVSLNMDGTVAHMNPMAETITGYQADELIGQNWLEMLVPGERFPEIHAELEGALSDQVPEQYENVILTQSGEERIISWSNSEIRRHDTVIGITSFGVDITERKHAQALLEESESRFRATFEQAAVGIAHVSPDGGFLRINQRFCGILGYTESEMLALTFQDITHPDDLEADLDRVNKLLVGEVETYSLEKKYFHKNGGIIWVNLTVSLLRTSDGKPDYFISVVEDISERKMAENARKETEEKFRAVVDQSPIAIQIHGLDGKLITSNVAWRELNAFDNEVLAEVKEKYSILEDEQATKLGIMPYIEKVYAGESVEFPLYNYTVIDTLEKLDFANSVPMARTRWIQTRGFPLKDEAGHVTSSVFMSVDITERKLAEMALQESEEEFRNLIEQSPISIQVLNPDGKITKVNKAFQYLWGISDEDLSEVLETYNILEDAEVEKLGMMPLFKKAFEGESVTLPIFEYDAPATMETLNIGHVQSNKRWIQARLYPVKNQAGDIINIVDMEEDMTEQKLAEERVQQHQQRLKALASQLTIAEERERRQIAADLHDNVGQSLAFARLRLAAAKKRATDEKLTAILTEVSDSLLESIQETRDLIFDLSSPAMHELGLGAAIAEWMEKQLQQRHGLEVECNDLAGPVPMTSDLRAILFRSVRELLTNIVKHAHARHVNVCLQRVENSLRIDIQDDGVGFVYESESGKPGYAGGFGLFSIEERMKDLGGRFQVVSHAGQGSTVTLWVPVDQAEEL
ncbi:PAS domain S-box protein [Planctomycetota bacterium]